MAASTWQRPLHRGTDDSDEVDLVDALLEELAAHAGDAIWVSDISRRRLFRANAACARVWATHGAPAYDGRAFLRSVHPHDLARVEATLDRPPVVPIDLEYRVRREDGGEHTVVERIVPVRCRDGVIRRLCGISRYSGRGWPIDPDVEARERWFRALFEHTSDLITVIDAEGRRVFHSPAVERVLAYTSAELENTPVIDLVHPDDRADIEQMLRELVRRPGHQVQAEYRLRTKAGSYVYLEAVAVSLLDHPDIRAIVVSARDRTTRHLSDPLTGMATSELLVHHLDLLRQRAGSEHCGYSLVLLGLDRFRAVNERIGEHEADELLCEISCRLQCVLEKGIVARVGGDVFAVVLEDAPGVNEAMSGVARMLSVFDDPFESSRGPLQITAGVGLVVAPTAMTSPREVLRSAESALASAKRAGPGRHEVFDPAMRKRALERLEIESALRGALNNGEIVVHYQPLVDLSSGRIAGFEALARWQRPGVGLVPPAAFIPVAEESGLICRLDLEVLRIATTQLARWRSAAPELLLSVNLSGRHFEDEHLVTRIEDFIAPGVPTTAVKLEITESVLVARPDRAAEVMLALQARGFVFGLDDFGTGYSSLSYLHRFPFGTLKIDRSFVSTLGSAQEKVGLVQAIVAMARSLGLAVVAEGVETDAQLAALRTFGCEFAQGFGLARPMDADAITALLARSPKW